MSRRVDSVRLLLWLAIGAFAAGFSALGVLMDETYQTGRFDLGNMVQAVWSTAHGHFLQVTDLHGEQVSRLGAHFDPILALYAPFWWIWPSANLLIVSQACILALGALPVFWLARKHLGSGHIALGFSLAYLLYPPVEWLALNEFHPVALACPLLLFAFWYLDEDRLVPFTVFAALAVLTKEEIGVVVAALGLWYALSRRRRLTGAAVFAAGLLTSFVALVLVIPHFNGGSHSAFYDRYSGVGGSPTGLLRTVFTHPGRIVSKVLRPRVLDYLAQLLVPLAAVPAFAPLVAVAALPELGVNILSATKTQTSVSFHYTAGVIPGLIAAYVIGAGRLAKARPHFSRTFGLAAAAIALLANYVVGPIPLWRAIPGGSHAFRLPSVSSHDLVVDQALKLIPPTGAVTTTNSLGAHLSARRRVFSFPTIRDAEWIVVDEKRLSYADRLTALPGASRLVLLRRDRHWKIVFERDGVLVFRQLPRPLGKRITAGSPS